MRRKIANLEVWIDDAPGAESHLQARPGSDDYRLLVAPNEDQKTQEDPEGLASVVAHELGHFMSHLLKDNAHLRLDAIARVVNFRKAIGDWSFELEKKFTREVQLPAEVQAWKYADMIYPNVKQDVRALALLSYEGYGGATND